MNLRAEMRYKVKWRGSSLINILKLMVVYCFIEKVMPVSKWFGVVVVVDLQVPFHPWDNN